MMSRFRSTDCLEKQEDLTEKSLTNLVRKYFQDENLNVEILGEDKKFLDANDNFSSDTRKLYLRIINSLLLVSHWLKTNYPMVSNCVKSRLRSRS